MELSAALAPEKEIGLSLIHILGILAAAMADAALIGMAYALVRYEPELIEIITPMTMLMAVSYTHLDVYKRQGWNTEDRDA